MVEKFRCPRCKSKILVVENNSPVRFIVYSDKSILFYPKDILLYKTNYINEIIENFLESIYNDFRSGKLSEKDVLEQVDSSFGKTINISLRCKDCNNVFDLKINIHLWYEYYNFFWKKLKIETNKVLKKIANISIQDIEEISGQTKVEIDIINSLFDYDPINYIKLKELKELAIKLPEERGGEAGLIIGSLLLTITGAAIYDILKFGVSKFIKITKSNIYQLKMRKIIRKKLANEDFDFLITNLSDSELERLLKIKRMPGLTMKKKKQLVENAIIKKTEEYKKKLYDIIEERNINEH